jgi:hypothetical protein
VLPSFSPNKEPTPEATGVVLITEVRGDPDQRRCLCRCWLCLVDLGGIVVQARHGFETRGLDVPRGVNPPTGRFGRMFPTLDRRPPAGLKMAEELACPAG